jgi:hypothetical protein
MNMLWLDKYERQARLVPGLFAVLPIPITVTALGFGRIPVISTIVSLLSLAGGPVLLADTVRRMGRKAERELWTIWGGAPTTLALRLREITANTIQRDHWRNAIQKVTGIKLESARSEAANPARSDQAIETAVSTLRELTRDNQRFYMIHVENMAYGRQRNLYGSRMVGRLIAIITLLIILGFALWPLINGKHPSFQAAYILGFILDVLILICWYLLPSSGQVRAAGDKYAYQLLQAAVTLATVTPQGPAPPP